MPQQVEIPAEVAHRRTSVTFLMYSEFLNVQRLSTTGDWDSRRSRLVQVTTKTQLDQFPQHPHLHLSTWGPQSRFYSSFFIFKVSWVSPVSLYPSEWQTTIILHGLEVIRLKMWFKEMMCFSYVPPPVFLFLNVWFYFQIINETQSDPYHQRYGSRIGYHERNNYQ